MTTPEDNPSKTEKRVPMTEDNPYGFTQHQLDNFMKDDKQQPTLCTIENCKSNGGTQNCIGKGCGWISKPTAEQIAQWEKEAKDYAIENYEPLHHKHTDDSNYIKLVSEYSYMGGRQAAFDEYSRSFEKDEDYKALQQELDAALSEIKYANKRWDDDKECAVKAEARVKTLENLLREVQGLNHLLTYSHSQDVRVRAQNIANKITSVLSGTEKQKES